VAESRIVELGDTEPYEGLWRLIRFGRNPLLAVALGTFLGIATIGALIALEHERDEARAAAAPCTPPGRLAKEVVRTFLGRIARGDRAALGACWEDPTLALPWADRLERTGGSSQVTILSEGLSSDPLGRIAYVLAMPVWRVDADVLWPSGRPKLFSLRDDGDGRWQLIGIRTPIWDFGSCTDTLATPVEVVRTFFAFLDERSVVGMEQCWVESDGRSAILSRYLASGGATSVSITANREVPGGAAVRVAVQWRASPWSGDCCQRWFVLQSHGGRWRIASVETSPPDR
jgi:hypothetical protein